MEINNPFQMNDWKITKFLKVVLALQLALWGVIGLDVIGVQIPILRQFIGFIYLTFVPGIVILRILKLHKLGNIETILYTVGLSIATIMFTGLFMNTVYPIFGISGPISITPLIITISVIVLLLCILSYIRDKEFPDPSYIDIKSVLSPPVLFLCLVPFLSVFGTYLMNFYQNNFLLMFLIITLVLIVVLIAFDMFIPKNLWPLAVFVIAISLLYHRSLISMYLTGWDIQVEYYISNLVKMNSQWDPMISASSCNVMLSIVMLAPIFSNICGMSLTWVFKLIYPLLFSLVPLGLYRVFQKQTNEKIALLSCFFFVFLFTFYTEMLALARQQIAELFFVLLILLMIDKKMDKIKRSFLFIIFGFSLAVSHYGLSYIYMFCLISAWLILVLSGNLMIQTLGDKFYSKFSRYKNEKLAGNPHSLKIEGRTISSTFVLLFVVFTLTWYLYVSTSSPFITLIHIGDHIASTIFTEFLNPEAAEGLGAITGKTLSPLHSATKYLHLITQIFIAVGVFTLLVKRKEMKFEDEYVAFSYAMFAICLAGIAVPHFASSLNTSRLYQITLIFLAPFCVTGCITFFSMVSRVVRASWTNNSVKNSLKVLSLFFAIFLLFNSGFVYEVAKDYPTSISLNNTIDYPRFNAQEVITGEWLKDKRNEELVIYLDEYRKLLLQGMLWRHELLIFKNEKIRIPLPMQSTYIFFGHENVKNEKIILINPQDIRVSVKLQDLPFYDTVLSSNKIYTNGDCYVLFIHR